MNFKWFGPVALLAALFIGDQIRINRPGHKFRLTVEVDTPDGLKAASGVLSVHPDRGYSRRGHTATRGDAVLVDLGGGKNLVALLAHIDKTVDLDDINYVALRAYKAAGRNPSFNEMGRMIETKLKWLSTADGSAAIAIKAAGLPTAEPFDAREAFTRK